jgi:hypothetical protein
MNTEKLITKGVKHHFNGKETVFEVDSLHKHFEGLLIHESDIFEVEQDGIEVEYVVESDVNFDDATEKELGMTYEEAEKLLRMGELIALPGWKGFWFKDIKTNEVLVLTKEGDILDTPWEICKERNDWVEAVATDEQNQLLRNYFASVEDIEVVDAEVLTGEIEHVVTTETPAPKEKIN